MAHSLHLVEPQGQLSTNTIITITGTADCSLLGVDCYEDSGTTLTQLESGHDGTGSISATYTVKEGSVEIFCDGTCEGTDEYIRSNVITITSEGELVVIFGQYTVYSIIKITIMWCVCYPPATTQKICIVVGRTD